MTASATQLAATRTSSTQLTRRHRGEARAAAVAAPQQLQHSNLWNDTVAQ
jgi:hypothetical protein